MSKTRQQPTTARRRELTETELRDARGGGYSSQVSLGRENTIEFLSFVGSVRTAREG